jgi:hypothetical protein
MTLDANGCNRLDCINQDQLSLDNYYSSGDYDGRGVHGKLLPGDPGSASYDKGLTMLHASVL